MRYPGEDVFINARHHRDVAKCRSLNPDWSDRVKDYREGHLAYGGHFAQHPCARHATFASTPVELMAFLQALTAFVRRSQHGLGEEDHV